MEGKEILLYLSIKYKGNWEAIYNAINQKEKLSENEVKILNSTIKSKYVTILDKEYPEYLKSIFRPPFVLFYYGNLSLLHDFQKNISCVGSRNASNYGKNITKDIVSKLVPKYNIVSGMAIGIDTVSHQTAIENNGKTIAVLGSGIDYVYPKQNQILYDQIKSNHLVVSEYPGNEAPLKENFLLRNRLVAAFCNTLIVTEAYVHSGTLSTVSNALTMGRDVCCVPYPANLNSACNSLIKEGARLVECAKDVDESCVF